MYPRPSILGVALVCLIGLTACGRSADEQAAVVAPEAEVSVDQFLEDSVTTLLVRTALVASGDINGKDISVTTTNGQVTLTGKVPALQIRRAEEIVRGIDGVKDVNNMLKPAGIYT